MGYIIWFNLGAYATITQSIVMPVYIYNAHDTSPIIAPENIRVVVEGPRHALRALTTDDYGIYVDAHEIKKDLPISLKRSHLFLPTSINVVSFSPQKIQLF
jgi:hypothetical protein